MITKEQYLDIVDQIEIYTNMYKKVIDINMSEDFQKGMKKALELIEGLVENR